MTITRKPLTARALNDYAEQLAAILDTETVAADVRDAVLALDAIGGDMGQARYKQLYDIMQAYGAYLSNGGVASLAIGAAGTGYEVGDRIFVTTSTGSGAVGRVSAVGGSGDITGVELNSPGIGYVPADTACTLESEVGAAATITATVGDNKLLLLTDALALLAA